MCVCGGVNEQPRRAVKGLPCVDGMGCGGTLDGRGCSGRRSTAWCLELPDEKDSELNAVLSFLALGHRWPWGVPAQDRGEWARVQRPLWDLRFVVFFKH